MKILALRTHYLPGYKSGGPIRSLSNLIESLGDEFMFKVVTLDRDAGESTPYEGIPTESWYRQGKADVWYLRSSGRVGGQLVDVLRKTDYDLLYINSYFSRLFSIWPLFLRKGGLIKDCPVVLAPRGEFSPGALAIREKRKMYFVRLAQLTQLHEDVIWQATCKEERDDIQRIMGENCKVLIASNLAVAGDEIAEGVDKTAGRLRAVFLSRISPKKNLDGALNLLAKVEGQVEFDIYGPAESGYWQRCQKQIESLPENIRVRYMGAIPHEEVTDTLRRYELFFFPTHGENFGHVLAEALLAGCPVLTSDQTPWNELEFREAGYALPLAEEARFVAVLEEFVNMGESTHSSYRTAARKYGEAKAGGKEAVEAHRRLFRQCLR